MSKQNKFNHIESKKEDFLFPCSYQILHFVMTFEHSKNSKVKFLYCRFSILNKLNFKPERTFKANQYPHFFSLLLTDERYRLV